MKNVLVKYLRDYKSLTHRISKVDFTFELSDLETKVSSKMIIIPQSDEATLVLNGEKIDKLLLVMINGEKLSESDFEVDEKELKLKNLPQKEFILEIQNIINPKGNTELEGLYKSSGIFCTQNEPEGMRRITYFIDRPDNLSIYTTKIIANKEKYPVLLSNGNLIEKGDLENDLHYVIWKDPYNKPAYLFALVAGNLTCREDTYKTLSGKNIDLKIYVEKKDSLKCFHAMDSLKKSMLWDEEKFGLEYDLDIYMIVAVDSFNMGAMENKGLNIFNSSCILADKKISTDNDYFMIESIIGHEYFHNYTGNRVTCRDWFQLTLKEGLTVFRDQEFSADLNFRPVCRINDVKILKRYQFTEDSGPNAHSIKPKSYISMNNFYTSTVYNKGAEIIRMVYTVLGKDGFRKGMDKYFELYDGCAVTTENFINAMSLANDCYDFSHFLLWYDQVGTPQLDIKYIHDKERGELKLTIKQTPSDIKDPVVNGPLFIPFKFSLIENKKELPLTLMIRNDQKDLERNILYLTNETEEFLFKVSKKRVVPSLNREFSSPLKITSNLTMDDLSFLMRNDTDEFCRYEAGFSFTKKILQEMMKEKKLNKIDLDYIQSLSAVIEDKEMDYSFKSLMLTFPTIEDLVRDQEIYDYKKAKHVISFFEKTIALEFEAKLQDIYNELNDKHEYKFDTYSMGKRSLKNRCLSILSHLERGEDLAKKQFLNTNNMTDKLAALYNVVHLNHPSSSTLLKIFHDDYQDESIVVEKWLRVQASSEEDSTFENVQKLLNSDIYNPIIPNIVRALLKTFAQNKIQFNHETGRGIKFIGQQIEVLDKINSQIASELASAFNDLKHMSIEIREIAEKELERILGIKGLSVNVYERISKILS